MARVARSRGDPVVCLGGPRIRCESRGNVVAPSLSQSESTEEVEGGGGAWREGTAAVFDRLQVGQFRWDKL